LNPFLKFFLFFSLGFLCLAQAYPQQDKKTGMHVAAKKLIFLDMLKDTVSYQNSIREKPLLLIYFRPDCEDCAYTARLLKAHAREYAVPVWLVSAAPLDQLQVFESMTGFYDGNIKVLQDYTNSMHDWFDFQWLPFIILLNKKGKAIKTFESLPSQPAITKLLQKQ